MSSEGFQLSQTIGGGKALCMTIGSLTPVKLAGGRAGEGGGRGCPHLPQQRERECTSALCGQNCVTVKAACLCAYRPNTGAAVAFNVHEINIWLHLRVLL